MRVSSKRRQNKNRLTDQQKAERRVAQKEQYRMLTDLYRLADLNSKGNPLKQGWTTAIAGLTPLKENPFLDPDYEFESEGRLSLKELKDLGL